MRDRFIKAVTNETRAGVTSGFELRFAHEIEQGYAFSVLGNLYDTKNIARQRSYEIERPERTPEGLLVRFGESMRGNSHYANFIKDSILALRRDEVKIETVCLYGFEDLALNDQKELVTQARLQIN